MLILIFLQLSSSKLCADYECSSLPLGSLNQCINKVGYTYYLSLCTAEYYSYCPPSYSDAFCGLPPVPSDINIAVPGEPCEFDRNCLDSLCNNLFCVGSTVNSQCTAHTQCDVGLYCRFSDNTCQTQKLSGAACATDEECVNSNGCSKQVCTPYFTVPSSTPISSCNGGVSFLCSSGVCHDILATSYCVPQIRSSGALPLSCLNDGDCQISSSVGPLKESYSTGCECGYNGFGDSYCNLAPGDPLYVNYTAAMQQWLSSSNVTLCHTTARTDLKCIQAHWNSTYFVQLAYYQAAVNNYPLVQGNDDCVQQTFTSEYWIAKANFDAMNPENPQKGWGRVLTLGLGLVILELI